MALRQYVEKPLKVMAEQYFLSADPPIAGVCTLAHDQFEDGRPHAHIPHVGGRELHDTDMIVWSKYDLDTILDVQTAEEFTDRFGQITAEEPT